ncbi:MAG: hypothetical protein H6579_02615 [Chitinophagales bacterium]|nr:hypothetical protein [Chitinophagales bacterium]
MSLPCFNVKVLLLTLLFLFSTSQKSFAQLKINSGGQNIVYKHDSIKKTDSIEMLINNSLSTSSSSGSNYRSNLMIAVQRNELKVVINITASNGIMPMELVVERKSSAPLAEYRTVKTITKSELEELALHGKLILEDLYPDARQLDSYYRLKYTFSDNSVKILPGVLLEKLNANDEPSISTEEVKKKFLKEEDTISYSYEEFGLLLNLERKGTIVNYTIQLREEMACPLNISIERKGTEPLASYRKIKELSMKELEQLQEAKLLSLTDNYPLSQKLNTVYRLSISFEKELWIALPDILLLGLRAN